MKKIFAFITFLFLFSVIANAQTTPTNVKTYLDKNYPNWTIGESWVVDSKPRKAFETGDFNGDGIKDYAMLLSKDDRIYTIVLLTTKNSFKAYNILAQNSENRWIAGIGMNKKGEVIELDPINSDKTIKLKTDAIYLYDGEGHGRTFYWENGKFVDSTQVAFLESDLKSFIGYEYDGRNIRDGLENVGGFVVSKNEMDVMNSNYVVSMIKPKASDSINPNWLWFEKLDKEGEMNLVLDVLRLPDLKKTETFSWGQCTLNGKFDGEIVAIAVYQETEFLTKIVKAWRANMSTEKFEEISIKGIKCANESYGV